jgi:hypothetical protein
MHDLTALRLNRQIDPKRSQQSRYPRTGGDDDSIGHDAPVIQADAEPAISARGDQLDEASRHSGAVMLRPPEQRCREASAVHTRTAGDVQTGKASVQRRKQCFCFVWCQPTNVTNLGGLCPSP